MKNAVTNLPPELLALTVAQLVKWLVAIGLFVSVMVWIKKYVWPIIRKTLQFLEDWNGESERPGVPARKGLMERLASIEYEFQPNSGASFSDKLTKIVTEQATHIEQIQALQKDVKSIKAHLNIKETGPIEVIERIENANDRGLVQGSE